MYYVRVSNESQNNSFTPSVLSHASLQSVLRVPDLLHPGDSRKPFKFYNITEFNYNLYLTEFNYTFS